MNMLGNVMVVDDNPDWCKQLRAILEEDGFVVQTASSRDEALRVLREQTLHVAIIDLKLDAGDLSKDEGFAVLQEISRLRLNEMVYSIMLTGYATPEHTRKAFREYGVVDFFEKGTFDRDEFREAVRAAMVKAKYKQSLYLKFICFKTGAACNVEIRSKPKHVFIAMPFSSTIISMRDVYEAIRAALSELGYTPLRVDERYLPIDLMCNICRSIQECQLGVVDISEGNPNVFLELGMMYGWGKPAIIVKHTDGRVPADLSGILYIEYEDATSLKMQLLKNLRNLE